MNELYRDTAELDATWRALLGRDDAGELRDERTARGPALDRLVETAVFHHDPAVVAHARSTIAAAATALDVWSASIRPLYLARGRGELHGFTVPAINLRGLTYDLARAAFRVAQRTDAAAMIFELARSEIGYTDQRPGEYAACVLAAALREGWRGPVFLQGDHYQVSAKRFADAQLREVEQRVLESLISEAIAASVCNIDIDSSTLVELSRPTVLEQQRDNFEVCAQLTRFIRENELGGTPISVGGEIGEVGGTNSTVEELRAFMAGFRDALGGRFDGLSKLSVQTGTHHGGVPAPGGGLLRVRVDFATLAELSKVAREEFGLAGAVQHGASTLPSEMFHVFPQIETAEIHLATGLQNLVFDHPAFPPELRAEIAAFCKREHGSERRPDDDEAQFLYRTRKKAWGPFKRRLWALPNKEPMIAAVEAEIEHLWKELNVIGTRALVARYVRAVEAAPSPTPPAPAPL
jgi:fructose/tagatose bisphosphate aldolase